MINIRQLIALFLAILTWSTGILGGEGFGTLKGRIIDYKSGEALIGANIVIAGTSLGAATDLDGRYYIYNIPPGTYDLTVSYVGYETQTIRRHEIQVKENHYLNVALIPSVMNLSEIVVEADASRYSDAYLISEQKKSANLQDGVSSAQISRSGDSNAADAVKRITGVSVLEGNNVYVRGLGDRYVSTQMNGAPLPSPEPEKKSIPLNLFSTGILESITAYKTFTPDLPGIFGGGTVDIRTKAYPDKRILNISAGLNGSTDMLTNSYRLGTRGKLDFIGFDDGSRAIPKVIPDDQILTKYQNSDLLSHYNKLGEYSRAFNSDMSSSRETPGLPVSLGANVGNRYTPTPNVEYGYYGNVNFSNHYGFKEESYRKYSVSDKNIITRTDLVNDKSSHKTNLSLSGSTGLKLYNLHKFKLSMLYTHTSENSFTYSRGKTPNLDENGIYLKDYYTEKSILNASLSGNHHLKFLNESRIEWSVNSGLSRLFEPDNKTHNYKYYAHEDIYRLASSSAKAGLREFTNGRDFNTNFDLNYYLTLKDRMGESYKMKTGGRLQYKTRTFQKRSFYYEFSDGSWPDELIVIDNTRDIDTFGALFSPDNSFYYNPADKSVREGLILLESTDGATRNAYDALELNNAFYWMIDAPLSFGRFKKMIPFRLIAGARIEDYRLNMSPYNPVTGSPYVSGILGGKKVKTNMHETTLLPSVNLVYNITDYQKFRLSYSSTVARAEFREVAPFEFQAFYGGNPVVGYPYLKTTHIRNYDFRYEWYRMAGEIFSIGTFFKEFDHPIEKVIIETADESYITYQNADHAYTYGFEIDYRTSLTVFPRELGKMMVIFNSTLSRSEVRSPESIMLFTGAQTPNNAESLTRPLQGQSDIMVNISLNYQGFDGFSGALTYNTYSPRLYALGTGSIPDEYEFPYHSLNVTLGKKIGPVKFNMKVKNLLNSDILFGFEKDGKTHITNQYHPGMGAGISVSYAM